MCECTYTAPYNYIYMCCANACIIIYTYIAPYHVRGAGLEVEDLVAPMDAVELRPQHEAPDPAEVVRAQPQLRARHKIGYCVITSMLHYKLDILHLAVRAQPQLRARYKIGCCLDIGYLFCMCISGCTCSAPLRVRLRALSSYAAAMLLCFVQRRCCKVV